MKAKKFNPLKTAWNITQDYTFMEFLKKMDQETSDGTIKLRYNFQGVCEYDNHSHIMRISCPDKEIKAFSKYQKETKKVKDCFGSIEDLYFDEVKVHEYSHAFLWDVISDVSTNRKNLSALEDYMVQCIKENKVADTYMGLHKNHNLSYERLIDALGDAVYVDENEKTQPLWRLQEAFAYWNELVLCHPFMNAESKEIFDNGIPKKLFDCLQKMFKITSFDRPAIRIISQRKKEKGKNQK